LPPFLQIRIQRSLRPLRQKRNRSSFFLIFRRSTTCIGSKPNSSWSLWISLSSSQGDRLQHFHWHFE